MKYTHLLLTLLFLSAVGYAQTFTINGHIKNMIDQPLEGLTVTLNTPTAESTTTDESGFFSLITMDYPTGIDEVSYSDQLIVYPSPAKQNISVQMPDEGGRLQVFNSLGQVVGELHAAEPLTLSATGLIYLKYTSPEGIFTTRKAIVEGPSVTIVPRVVYDMKSAVEDTIAFKLNIQGIISENEIDTLVNITGFNSSQSNHSQDFKIDTKQVWLNAKTISMGKVADERNYSLKDANYISSRLIGGLEVAVTNNDGSFYKEIVSDANGNVPAFEVPEKGSYFYLIEAGKTHEAAIKFIVDSLENNEVFAAADTELSVWNALQVHFDYAGGGSVLIPRSDGMNRTKNWKPEYLVPGVMNHVMMTVVWDDATGSYTDETVSQEKIDSVLNVREKSLDKALNKFYKNGNTVITDDILAVSAEGRTHHHFFKNYFAGGTYGAVERNNMFIRGIIGLNIDKWNEGSSTVIRTLNQENLSVKGPGELQKAKKPSVFEAGGLAYNVTDDDKRSLEWYQVRSEMLSDDGVPQKGIWGWDIDQRVFEEANQNQYVQSFINKYGTTETINEFQKYVNGEKSASLKSAKDEYKLTIGIIDLEGQVTKKVVTEDNFKEALQDKEIPTFYKQEIKTLFEN